MIQTILKNSSVSRLTMIPGYFLYLLYLYLSENLTVSFVIVPLLILLFKPGLKAKIGMLLVAFCFDYPLTFEMINPYEHFSPVFQLVNVTQKSSYLFLLPIVSVITLIALYYAAWLLSKLRKKRTYYVLPFILVSIILIVYSYEGFVGQNSLIGFMFATGISLFAKKFWLLYLLALELQYKKVSVIDTIGGFTVPTANFRESFKLNEYQTNLEQKTKEDFANPYWLAVTLSGLMVLLIILYNQIYYQLTGIATTTVYPDPHSYNLICNSTFTSSHEYISQSSSGEVLGCFLATGLVRGVVKHLLIDSMIFVIPLLMMGFRFSFPYSNFLKAKSWNSFLFKLFYYYSLIIFRIFTVEFYKLLLAIFKTRNRFVLPVATFLGVFLGGYCYHILKDFAYVQQFNKGNIFSTIFSPSPFLYFFTIAVMCTFSDRLYKKRKWLNIVLMNLAFFIIFFMSRSFYTVYFRKVPLQIKFEVLLKILNIK